MRNLFTAIILVTLKFNLTDGANCKCSPEFSNCVEGSCSSDFGCLKATTASKKIYMMCATMGVIPEESDKCTFTKYADLTEKEKKDTPFKEDVTLCHCSGNYCNKAEGSDDAKSTNCKCDYGTPNCLGGSCPSNFGCLKATTASQRIIKMCSPAPIRHEERDRCTFYKYDTLTEEQKSNSQIKEDVTICHCSGNYCNKAERSSLFIFMVTMPILIAVQQI